MSREIEIRHAAKVILTDSDGNVIFVEGKSGRKNLPGGGVDEGESSREALLREIPEEIRVDEHHIEDLTEIACIQGIVTPSHGRHELARWTLFTAKLHPDARPRKGNEIQEIVPMAAVDVPSYLGPMSHLAKQAVIDLVLT